MARSIGFRASLTRKERRRRTNTRREILLNRGGRRGWSERTFVPDQRQLFDSVRLSQSRRFNDRRDAPTTRFPRFLVFSFSRFICNRPASHARNNRTNVSRRGHDSVTRMHIRRHVLSTLLPFDFSFVARAHDNAQLKHQNSFTFRIEKQYEFHSYEWVEYHAISVQKEQLNTRRMQTGLQRPR